MKEWSHKEVVVMVTMIGLLSQHLDADSTEVHSQVGEAMSGLFFCVCSSIQC